MGNKICGAGWAGDASSDLVALVLLQPHIRNKIRRGGLSAAEASWG
jgi:hypothetical protein